MNESPASAPSEVATERFRPGRRFRKSTMHMTKELFVEAKARGMTIRALADQLELPESTVRTAIARLGVDWKRRRHPDYCANGHPRKGNSEIVDGAWSCLTCDKGRQVRYRSRRRAANGTTKPPRRVGPIPVPKHSWIEWMEQSAREESMPPYLRGRADAIKRWLNERNIKP